ncbi:MAG: hypothetical protein ACRDRL_27865 [Sciscionella sp.]
MTPRPLCDGCGADVPTRPDRFGTRWCRRCNQKIWEMLMTDRITCGRCAAAWTGISRAHCGACHRTFASVSLFDAHRHPHGEHGGCVDPASLRSHGQPLRLTGVMWHGPEDPRFSGYDAASALKGPSESQHTGAGVQRPEIGDAA